MSEQRLVICPKCDKETEVRWGMLAHATLANHDYKEHREHKEKS